MNDHEHSILIEYTFTSVPVDDKPGSLQLNINVRKDTSEEEAAQILVRAYQTVASRVLQKHIVMGCEGCASCKMNEEAMRGIDRAIYQLH